MIGFQNFERFGRNLADVFTQLNAVLSQKVLRENSQVIFTFSQWREMNRDDAQAEI